MILSVKNCLGFRTLKLLRYGKATIRNSQRYLYHRIETRNSASGYLNRIMITNPNECVACEAVIYEKHFVVFVRHRHHQILHAFDCNFDFREGEECYQTSS